MVLSILSRSFVEIFTPRQRFIPPFRIYWNFLVNLPHFIFESVLSCVCLSCCLITSPHVFSYYVALYTQGIPCVNWDYVIILMSFYVSP